MIPDSVPAQYRQPSDDAKRCADTITLAVIAGAVGKFFAIRLSDGGSDQVPYDTREDAIRHQLRPEYCTYVKVPPDGMKPHEAEALLAYWRALRDANVRDDDLATPMPLMPLLAADRRRQIRVLSKGRR